MNRIYLDDKLLQYYKEALIQEIDNKSIDDDIEENLLKISNSQNIRPVFSKRGKDMLGRNLASYLMIGFTSNVDKSLFNNIIPYFESNYNLTWKYECKCFEVPPYTNPKMEITDANKGSKWLTDSDYFNISKIRFDLNGGTIELHNKFWMDLSDYLSKDD